MGVRKLVIPIRWNQHEKDIIDEVRADINFSEYVRDAALEKALKESEKNV